jgi:hypothetical protein
MSYWQKPQSNWGNGGPNRGVGGMGAEVGAALLGGAAAFYSDYEFKQR